MSDFLLELSQNPTAKKIIQAAGLPIPMPTPLDRLKGPATTDLFKGAPVVGGGEGQLAELVAGDLPHAGADPFVACDKLLNTFIAHGEKHHRKPTRLLPDEAPEGVKAKALVFDATGLGGPADLKRIYEFFKPRARSVARSGRLLILARPP